MEGTVRQQRLEHGIDAANRVQILRKKSSARLQVGEQRRAFSDASEIVEREADARFVRDRGDVQGGVGRAAGGGDGGAGVFQALLRDELARPRSIVREKFHYGGTRVARETGSIG